MSEHAKLDRIIIADPDPTVRQDLGNLLTNLAHMVERFSEGPMAISYARENPAEMFIMSIDSFRSIDEALSAIKQARNHCNELIVTHRKLLPKQVGKLKRYKVEHSLGHPIDPLYLFRLAHERFGIIARRDERINAQCEVFWKNGPQREVIGHTRDISRGGILLVTGRELGRGTSMFFGVQLDQDTAIEVRGEVVKIDAQAYLPEIGYGISFIALPSTTGMLIDQTVRTERKKGADTAPITFLPSPSASS